MALTLEATLIIPLTAIITLGVISRGVSLSGQVEREFDSEYSAIHSTLVNKELYNSEIIDLPELNIWYQVISINPIKFKETINYCNETIGYISDFIPIIKDLGGFNENDTPQ